MRRRKLTLFIENHENWKAEYSIMSCCRPISGKRQSILLSTFHCSLFSIRFTCNQQGCHTPVCLNHLTAPIEMSQQGSSSQPQAKDIDCYALTPLLMPPNNSTLPDDFEQLKLPSDKDGARQQTSGEQEERRKSQSFRGFNCSPRVRSYDKVLEWVCSDETDVTDEPAGTPAQSPSKEGPHHRKFSHDNFNPKRFRPLLEELLGEERPGEATLATMALSRKRAESASTTASGVTESENPTSQPAESNRNVLNKTLESLIKSNNE
ncbi:hypothetical protein Ddc_16231 [Ditylenchus destructor]|nr:hypothetical protein Ddc_16231 [Ditylenchus destructor]